MNRIFRELTHIPESSRALPLLLMFSAILMGALFIVRWNADLNFDGQIYISAARKYAAGMYREGLAIYAMPLYPYLISLIHKLIPNWVLAGRLISYFSMTFRRTTFGTPKTHHFESSIPYSLCNSSITNF